MIRFCFVTLLLVGFSSLTACRGASNDALTPGVSAASVRPLTIDVLHDFNLPPDAEAPYGGLLAGKNGEYYGTSTQGGAAHEGAVYEITTAGKENVIYSFKGAPDGASPRGPLIMDKEGALYGTTGGGGMGNACAIKYGYGGCGTVFKLTSGKGGWTESVLYAFQGGDNDGAVPDSGLLMTKSGALLGTTSGGGDASRHRLGGVVFELTPSGSTYSEKVVHTFSGAPDGVFPLDGLVPDSSGNLYGTTVGGGLIKLGCHKVHDDGCGTVFKLTPSGSTYAYSVIYRFKGGASDGSHPAASLLPRPNGIFYGLTIDGGGLRAGLGTVFSITAGGSEHVVYRFQGGNDGEDPDDTPGLVADRSGNLYGTTAFGGGTNNVVCSGGCGTVFKLAPSKSGFTHSVLFEFQNGADGALPFGGVIIDSKGNLLGPTSNGGDLSYCGCGTIFSIPR
jgi:uncharacterized repeat protein (TIGR03803 family)